MFLRDWEQQVDVQCLTQQDTVLKSNSVELHNVAI